MRTIETLVIKMYKVADDILLELMKKNFEFREATLKN